MTIWEGADNLRKTLNWIVPFVTIGFALLDNLVIYALWNPPGPFDFIYNLFAGLAGGTRFSTFVIARTIVGILAGVIYFIPKFGPFKGVKDDELHVWPEHVMMIIITGMAFFGTYIGGLAMLAQFLFVCILGSDPIWEASSSGA